MERHIDRLEEENVHSDSPTPPQLEGRLAFGYMRFALIRVDVAGLPYLYRDSWEGRPRRAGRNTVVYL